MIGMIRGESRASAAYRANLPRFFPLEAAAHCIITQPFRVTRVAIPDPIW